MMIVSLSTPELRQVHVKSSIISDKSEESLKSIVTKQSQSLQVQVSSHFKGAICKFSLLTKVEMVLA